MAQKTYERFVGADDVGLAVGVVVDGPCAHGLVPEAVMRGMASGIATAAVRVLGLITPALVFPTLAGCGGVLDPRGPIGGAERSILVTSVAIMLLIVVPVIVATLVFAWWFRASNMRARRRPEWAFSGRLELLVWSVPALVVMFLGGIAWTSSHALDPARPLESRVGSGARAIEIQVVSLDWKWLFIYPDQGIAAVNGLVVPAGVPVHFRLTSATVMNSFFVPQLGSQIYTMAGMENQLYLQAARPGVFPGLSAHFSGDGFADMKFDARAVPPAQFASWAAGVRGRGTVLDTHAYAELARPGSVLRPHVFRAVQPGLFDAIVMQRVPEATPVPPHDGRAVATPTPRA